MFKISYFILFLSIFFMSFFSYGQGEDFLSDGQALEQPKSEALSLESPKGVNNISNPVEKSVLSIKGEGLISAPLFEKVVPAVPVVSLELQTPFKTKKNLKWLVQAGGGVTVDFILPYSERFNVYASVSAGLRYDFQPWAASFTLGGVVTPQLLDSKNIPVSGPVLSYIKWALSLERKFTNVNLGLTAGSFATIVNPFIGLSVRYPLKTW